MGGTDPARQDPLRLFLAGDVMLGRGIDQILPAPGDPELFEDFVKSAIRYVDLAEQVSGPVPRGVTFDYVWGDLLADLDPRRCHLRLINLETAITTARTPEPKGINYRMSPENIAVLTAAKIDLCTLANNHLLDWGPAGLSETLDSLDAAGIGRAGAGRTDAEAARPFTRPLPGGGNLHVLAAADRSSGVPPRWAAGPDRPGVTLLPEDPDAALAALCALTAQFRDDGDITVLSVHWGPNWGYGVPAARRTLARRAVDEAGIDLVFGHSSHHPKGIELHRGKLIVYGAGDLINDYEGIAGYETFRPDLGLAFIADLDRATGRLVALDLLPYRRQKLRLGRADADATGWLLAMLRRESRLDGGALQQTADDAIRLVLPALPG